MATAVTSNQQQAGLKSLFMQTHGAASGAVLRFIAEYRQFFFEAEPTGWRPHPGQ
jgi:hypothetical protein